MDTENVLDLQRHLNCPYYQKKDCPMFEIISHRKGVEISQSMNMPTLVFVVEGEIEFSFGSNTGLTAHRDEFFMLPADTDFSVRFRETASLICFFIAADTDFCWRIRQKLSGYPSHAAGHNLILSSIDTIRNFIDVFLAITGKGILCVKYLNCQICALLDLICVFYPAESLVDFFEPLRSFAFGHGINFKQEVLKNRNKLFRVSEFAASTHMSHAAFRRKFVRIFGTNPHEWINHERMQLIEQELKYGILSLQQLAQKAGFASAAEFYAFCRKHLGRTAAEIRKEGGL
jgi:AraC-like DNA-binding protein